MRVPKNARQPSKSPNQQGRVELTPRGSGVNGGGLGAGPDVARLGAVAWAHGQMGTARWRFLCERFVEEAYGTRQEAPTAIALARQLPLNRGSAASAPKGALVFFAADAANRGWGHVGLSLGDGRMISALDRVRVTNVARSPYWRSRYLGWSFAPSRWPGRLPPPPGATTPLVSAAVQITAPAFGSTVGGSVPLVAKAAFVGGVTFDAFYATNPSDASTAGWHAIGSAQVSQDGDWVLDWDTRGVPDQGSGSLGTVTVAATALDQSGRRTGTRDYRRIAVNNAAPTATPTTPGTGTSTTPTGGGQSQTWRETTGGVAHTWTNYVNAGGTEGPTIGANQGVDISCKVTGFRVADGNTWWYRIHSPPWNDSFYVSADAFYNNGATSGSLVGTPFVDPQVRDC